MQFWTFFITGCACVCLLCPCVWLVHVHVYAQPTEHQGLPWSWNYHSSPVFENRMAPQGVNREVMVWCEFFPSQNWYTDYLNSSVCIVSPLLPWLLFSLLCNNPNKQFYPLSSHFSNSSLGLIAAFTSFLSLSPSSPPSSVSGLINTPTTRCFHCAKGTSTHLLRRPVSLQQGNLFVQARY